jgi:predicted nucleic acid-binding protein
VSTLVDSNVLIDVLSLHEEWGSWSAAMLTRAAEEGVVVINPIIYAEVCFGYDSLEAVDDALPAEYYRREPLPWAASFLASQAFIAYRQRGGVKRSRLPDFYIGAHAAVGGHTLLTRDPKRYRSYFPKLRIVAP